MRGNVEQFKQFLAGLDEEERANYQALLQSVEHEVKARAQRRGVTISFGLESAMDLIMGTWKWMEVQNGNIHRKNTAKS